MKIPTHAINGDYIREWLVPGPFFSSDLEIDFLADVGGEATIHPQEGDMVHLTPQPPSHPPLPLQRRGGKWENSPPLVEPAPLHRGEGVGERSGTSLTRRRYQSPVNLVDLSNAFGRQEYTTAYAACLLQSETRGVSRIYIESDTALALWMNGQLAHRFLFSSSLTRDEPHVFEADLKGGANLCLVKVHQGVGDWNFAIRPTILPPICAVLSGGVTDEAGLPIPKAEVRLQQNGEEIAQTWTDATGSYRISTYPWVV